MVKERNSVFVNFGSPYNRQTTRNGALGNADSMSDNLLDCKSDSFTLKSPRKASNAQDILNTQRNKVVAAEKVTKLEQGYNDVLRFYNQKASEEREVQN